MAFSMKKILQRKRAIIILVLIALFIVGARFFLSSRKTYANSTTVKRGDIQEEITLSGEIAAEEHVVLRFQTAGLLSWVGVKEGERVEKYQAIASLDSRQIRRTLEKRLADYSKTRWDFEQTKDDYTGAIVTDKIKRILEKSQFDLDNAVRDVELQDLVIELSVLTSPIEGIATRVDAPSAGVNVTASNTQFEIVNPETLFFDATADQTEVILLSVGQKGKIVFDSYPDKDIESEISTISYTPKQDETGTVYEVKIKLGNLNTVNTIYRIGMTGDITFVTQERKNVLYLPLSFVKSDERGSFTITGPKKEKKHIQTGLETDSEVEIRQGLKEGDIVYD